MVSGIDFLFQAQEVKVEPKSWMKDETYQFILVTDQTLKDCIDACIESGLYSLDLETTGLDNRVFDGETKDKIVGVCLSPDGKRGYYLPLRHKEGANISWSHFKSEMLRLIESDARAIFHNGKFDQEFLQFCGGAPIGEWDKPQKWEDTLILAYVENTRRKSKGLKALSKELLGMEMIEIKELFPSNKRKGSLDFSTLDPSWEPVLWYTASDAICTYKLYEVISPAVLDPSGEGDSKSVYYLEKACVTATRWMERARIMTDQDKAKELIQIGQREWLGCLEEVYSSASDLLGRDIRPFFFKIMSGLTEEAPTARFDPEDTSVFYMDKVDQAKREASRLSLDNKEVITKTVPSLIDKNKTENVDFLLSYDILSPEQLGLLMRELKVPGLKLTEKSGQVKTSKDELNRVLDKAGDQFPFAKKIQRFREVGKALSTYLFPLVEDCHTDHTVKANFNAHRVDTGRFSAPSSRRPKLDGGTRFPFHGTPSTYDPNRPECLARIRECIISRPGKILAAIDYAGVELRIATNFSQEPLWVAEFFRCSKCSTTFDRGDGTGTPTPPPPFCPKCGSDKIGDLHTLTGLSIYGQQAIKRKDWKALRGNAKATNFALCYGGSGKAVSRATGVDDEEGGRIKQKFDSTYKGLKAWWSRQHKYARKHGFVLTAFGRKYPVPDIKLPRIDPQTGRKNGAFIAKAERNSVNGPIQGTSADITKLAMSLVYKECAKRGWLEKVHMLITMHDELVFEIDKDILSEAIDVIVECMAFNPVIIKKNWSVPLTVDVELGYDWMVPWDLNHIRKSGEWPDELKDLFNKEQGVEEVVEPEPEPEEMPVEVIYAKSPPVAPITIKELSPKSVEQLAIAIFGSRDEQGSFLHFVGFDKEHIKTVWGSEAPEALRVDLEKFKILAEGLIE